MRVTLVVVGKPRNSALGEATRDYESRAARYWPLEVVEVREESSRSLSPDVVRVREGERVLARVPAESRLIACDVGGDQFTSEMFAEMLQAHRDRGESVAFAIGGAHGLGEQVRQRATRKMSLAPFTMPHELARLVLAEQLYRAGTIQRGEPYHK